MQRNKLKFVDYISVNDAIHYFKQERIPISDVVKLFVIDNSSDDLDFYIDHLALCRNCRIAFELTCAFIATQSMAKQKLFDTNELFCPNAYVRCDAPNENDVAFQGKIIYQYNKDNKFIPIATVIYDEESNITIDKYSPAVS